MPFQAQPCGANPSFKLLYRKKRKGKLSPALPVCKNLITSFLNYFAVLAFNPLNASVKRDL
jgi:hypothetical protein